MFISNPRKSSSSANFEKNWVYTINLKNQGAKPGKNQRFVESGIFLGFEINIDFSRH